MSEYNLYEVFAIIFFAVVGGFGFGIAISSYFNIRFLQKMEIRLDKLRMEIEEDE